MKKILILVIAIVMLENIIYSQEKKEGIELTVYNNNLGFIREKRVIELPKGLGEIKFTDIPKLIDATSVHFKSIDDPKVVILDQNYEYDLVSSDKLLQKYIDSKITVITKDKGEMYEGILMSYDPNQLVIKTAKGLAMVNRANVQDIRFESLPEGLITKPTLVWYLDGGKGGKQLCEIAYLTDGINWRCDYTVVISEDDKEFKDFAGWVTINNASGATYKNARLKLIAGDVRRITPPPMIRRRWEEAKYMMEQAQQGFVEKAFFEYHLYTLGRLVTVKDNQIKQEELINTHNVKVNKIYEYNGERNPKVQVKLEFKNSKENNMGMPLPKGRVRVYKEDKDTKSLEFIGEDEIDHTPKDEKQKIYIGDAFDIVGERKLTDRKVFERMREDSYEIKIRNHKEKAIEVIVIENMYGEWEILKENFEHTKKDMNTCEWKLSIPKDGETILKYTVRCKW
jgi:hypothetical protein